ncbi:unnamed protein product [Protopolystoma xenopodis]|uniref:Uncharacterized protein n=1 Tax=Protopolystoma xenopodis TaxID=117903 RepID=A0A448XHV3_9PLAT|nr:unnamed protein product [Protopolystoma xenopodis]
MQNSQISVTETNCHVPSKHSESVLAEGSLPNCLTDGCSDPSTESTFPAEASEQLQARSPISSICYSARLASSVCSSDPSSQLAVWAIGQTPCEIDICSTVQPNHATISNQSDFFDDAGRVSAIPSSKEPLNVVQSAGDWRCLSGISDFPDKFPQQLDVEQTGIEPRVEVKIPCDEYKSLKREPNGNTSRHIARSHFREKSKDLNNFPALSSHILYHSESFVIFLRVITNPVWLGVTCTTVVEQSIVCAFLTFAAKYLQELFRVPAYLASIHTGW